MNYPIRIVFSLLACLLAADAHRPAVEATQAEWRPQTRVAIVNGQWQINDAVTHRGAKAEGLLMNVRMVNALFEDANDQTRPKGFDPDANTAAFIEKIPDYAAHGVRAFTLNFQGGMPNYQGAINSAFNPDGSLRDGYLKRVRRVIEACDRHGVVIILGCYYQRQDQVLKDEGAVRVGVANVAKWIKDSAFTNVVLEIANEFAHPGFDHALLKSSRGEAELIALAKKTAPELLVSTSGMGSGTLPDEVAKASDFLLIHFNTTQLDKYPGLIAALKKYGKPIVCNEDEKVGEEGAKAAELCVTGGVSWGFMHNQVNQYFPKLSFNGAADDPLVYATLKRLTSAAANGPATEKSDTQRVVREEIEWLSVKEIVYFPPPDSAGGWRTLRDADEIRRVAGRVAGMDKKKLDEAFEFIKGEHEERRHPGASARKTLQLVIAGIKT